MFFLLAWGALLPFHYLHLVSAPVQIHQGTADRTTPPQWALTIRDGLQAAGKSVEYFEYPGQGHAFEGDSWQLFLERTLEFLERHLTVMEQPAR